jgi:hypothetical protein
MIELPDDAEIIGETIRTAEVCPEHDGAAEF